MATSQWTSSRVTQFVRALRDVGVQMIPAYSPQARGRSERSFGTWQGRLPQELRLKEIHTVAEANHFLCQHYVPSSIAASRCRRPSAAAYHRPRQHRQLPDPGSADRQGMLAHTLAGCKVIVHQHLDGALSMTHGPRRLGHYTSQGTPISQSDTKQAVEKTLRGKVQKPTFPPRLEIPQTPQDSHFPTATTAA